MVSVGLSRRSRRVSTRRRPRDFSPTTYSAPATVRQLSQAYHKIPRPRWRRYWLMAILLLPLAALVVLAFLPVWQIKNIIINHVPSRVTEQRILKILQAVTNEHRWWLLPQANLIFFSTSRAREAIGREFYAESLTFDRHWPNVLRVNVAENLVVARWAIGERSFVVDKRGLLVQELPADWPAKELVLVHDLTSRSEAEAPEPKLGDEVAPENAMTFLSLMAAAWRQELPKLELSYVQFDAQALPTVQAYTPTGWYVFFSTQEDPLIQIVSLRRLLEDKIKADAARLEYIDVRFVSRLYYKLH
ncbi:MAG: hypothetical protein HY974_01430 [Candidatus Kerfeldbacteria bacterium]|nr:hypothetical protein [Candidatus Kerfeldbacteria bacterium]